MESHLGQLNKYKVCIKNKNKNEGACLIHGSPAEILGLLLILNSRFPSEPTKEMCPHLRRLYLPHTVLRLLKCCFTLTATLKKVKLTGEELGVPWVRQLVPNPATLDRERENLSPSLSDLTDHSCPAQRLPLWQSLNWLWPPSSLLPHHSPS